MGVSKVSVLYIYIYIYIDYVKFISTKKIISNLLFSLMIY